MTAIEALQAVEKAGGSLALNGCQIKYAIPKPAAWLVAELKQNRAEWIELLRESRTPPPMPPGVRLLKWEPKTPPVAIVRMGIVSNVDKFIGATLRECGRGWKVRTFLRGIGRCANSSTDWSRSEWR
jgi:hypothetical protein